MVKVSLSSVVAVQSKRPASTTVPLTLKTMALIRDVGCCVMLRFEGELIGCEIVVIHCGLGINIPKVWSADHQAYLDISKVRIYKATVEQLKRLWAATVVW